MAFGDSDSGGGGGSSGGFGGFSFGKKDVSSLGGAANDLFSAFATSSSLKLKAEGDLVEAQNYDLAAGLARQNKQFTEQSTAVKQIMSDRQIYLGIGSEKAGIAGAGFSTSSGSALDLLRSSASQGALQKQLVGQQGLITEAGYDEQDKAYTNLANFAREAADKENDMAGMSLIGGGVSAAFKVGSIFMGG